MIFGLSVLFSPPVLANSSKIAELLELPEDRIDIGIAALTFAKEVFPNIDIEAYSKKLDLLAAKARRLAKGRQDPDGRIRALNTLLYQVEGFGYDHSTAADEKIENRFLNGILDTKKGTCVTLPMLYLAVAQRLGYPVYPVAAPDHLFLRYVDDSLKEQNIEATSGGGYASDETIIRDFHISQHAIQRGAYLRTMTYRQFLADLLAENAIFLSRNGNLDKAIGYLEKAVQINPQFPDYYELLRSCYAEKSKKVDGDLTRKYRSKADGYFRKAIELGLVPIR